MDQNALVRKIKIKLKFSTKCDLNYLHIYFIPLCILKISILILSQQFN